MEVTDGRKEKRLEIEIKERSSWRYLFGRWVFKISGFIILVFYPVSSVIHLFGIPNIFDLDEIYWEVAEHNLSIDFVKYGLILFLLNIFTIRFWILRGRYSLFSVADLGRVPIYPDRERDKSFKNGSLNVFFYLLIFQSLGIIFNPFNWDTSINTIAKNSSVFPYYMIHILFLLYFLISYLVVSNIKVKSDEEKI